MKTVLIFATLAAVVTGCGGSDEPDESHVAVTAAFYTLAEAVRQVGGDRVQVTDLTPPGAEPHDLELEPDQVDGLLDADLVVVMGQHFQPAVEDVAADREGPTIEVLTAGDGDDPHVWLDPTRLRAIVTDVAGALVEVDPDGADTYASNARAYEKRLDALDAEMADGLASCERDEIVTAHEAFGWLARRYGLTQEAIAGISPDQEPDPRRVAELADLVRSDGVTTIFTEELVSPDVADALAREVGVTIAVLNPLEGLSPDEVEAGDDYISVMQSNLASLQTALGCS